MFKEEANDAGGDRFVDPDLVQGMLRRGFDRMAATIDPMSRAVAMMVLITEYHPFSVYLSLPAGPIGRDRRATSGSSLARARTGPFRPGARLGCLSGAGGELKTSPPTSPPERVTTNGSETLSGTRWRINGVR